MTENAFNPDFSENFSENDCNFCVSQRDGNNQCKHDCLASKQRSFSKRPKLIELSDSRFSQSILMTKHYVLIPSSFSDILKSNEEVIKSKAKRNQSFHVRAFRRHLSAEKRYRESINRKLDKLRSQINCPTKFRKRRLLTATKRFIEMLKRKNQVLKIENKYLRTLG